VGERLFYRVSEVGDLLSCSKSTAYALVARGAIPSVRIGGLLRVHRDVFGELAREALNSAARTQPECESREGDAPDALVAVRRRQPR
jgi:excisionase family DNA binding protein